MAEPTMSHVEAVAAPELERCPLMPTYGAPSVKFVRGEGTLLWDEHGNEYLDFLSGLAVVSLGHSHPAVADAVAVQARTLQHVSNLFATEPGWEVALTLDRLLGGGGQVFFCNSGAEANEAAIKLARRYGGHGRYVVVSALRSFHGRTLATLHATGQPEKHEPFQPLPDGFRHVGYGDVGELERVLDPTVAAVLLEVVQGEGGINVASPEYLHAVRELCDERNLLLIVDEIQTGLARTAEWFAFQHSGLRPDVVTMAKALGNGMPIGACWARADVAASFRPGDHATTFGGQPLATAAAKATLAVMEEIDAPALARVQGETLRSALLGLEGVDDVRGLGLLLAAELTPEALAGRTAAEVAAECLQAGLVLNGVTPTALRLAPPLTVSNGEIAAAIDKLSEVITS